MNGSAVFQCQPLPSMGLSVVWLVNGSTFIDTFPGFAVATTTTGGGEELRVTGCQPEWNLTRVSCILTSPNQSIAMPTTSTLIVTREASTTHWECSYGASWSNMLLFSGAGVEGELQGFVTRYWLWFFIVSVCKGGQIRGHPLYLSPSPSLPSSSATAGVSCGRPPVHAVRMLHVCVLLLLLQQDQERENER